MSPFSFLPSMPKLSKLQFAELVRSMPGASEEEILAEASRREAQPQAEQPKSATLEIANSIGGPLAAAAAYKLLPNWLRSATDAVAAPALRVAPALGGAMLGGVLGGPVGAAVGGAAGAGLGEAGAEGVEIQTGQRDGFNPGQIAFQSALGAVPTVGKVGSVLKGALNRGAQGALLGGVGAAGTEFAETGELPSAKNVAIGAGAGALLGGGMGAVEGRMAGRAAAVMPPVAEPPSQALAKLEPIPAPGPIASSQDPNGPLSAYKPGYKEAVELRKAMRRGEIIDVPATAPEDLTDYRNSGLAFKNFFSDVTKGAEQYKPQAEWQPLLQHEGNPFLEEFSKHTGNFDNHIATSIPAFRDVQIRKGNALAKTFGEGASMLDIGASEGSFAKTVSALSGGRIRSVALDPNPDMANFFRTKSQVPGAEYLEEAFHQGFDDAGRVYAAHNPAEPYDIVHESMAFQFISPERGAQVAEAKRLMKPGGVFLTEQKLLADPETWKANELLKDTKFKKNYYSDDALAQKQKVVKFNQDPAEEKAVGMVDNMVQSAELEDILQQNFRYVAQYYDAGNFKGYAASDDPQKLTQFVQSMGDVNTEFSTAQTPRVVRKAPVEQPQFFQRPGQTGEPQPETTFYKGVENAPEIPAMRPAAATQKSFWEDQQALNSASAQDRERFAQIYQQDPRNQVPRSGIKPTQAVSQSDLRDGQLAASEATSAPNFAQRGIETEAPSPLQGAYSPEMPAVKAAQLHNAKGGSTFSLAKGELGSDAGYSVSPYKGREVVVDGPSVTPEQMEEFIANNAELLQRENHSIGTWFNPEDGKSYLDVSVQVNSLDEALELGRQNNQLSIFEHATGEVITVPKSGLTGAAPAVSRMAGDVPAEFHAVEAQTAPPSAGQPEPTFGQSHGAQQRGVDTEKARVDAFRAKAAEERGEVPLPRTGGSTALGVAAFGAQGLVGDDKLLDFGDEDTNAMVRAGMGGLGLLGMGKVLAKVPKPKGVFKSEKGFQAYHPVTGRAMKIGLDENADNLRKPIVTQGIEPKWEGEFAKVGLKNGVAPPAKSFDQLVSVKRGQLRFNKEVEARLRTLYRYGQEKFAEDGGAEWLENGILDDMLKFLPVDKPATASHRLFGALSPNTDVLGNMVDMLRVSLRAKKHTERGTLDLDNPDFVKKSLMKGVGNKPSKAPNVARALKGEPLQSYGAPDKFPTGKVDHLAKGMAGELDAIPFDLWWARAVGLTHDAQPANGYAYKLLFEAGADIARKMGEQPFPFMAKVWAAMKHLHGGGGEVAPNKLAREMGLGQKDLFDGSTIPSGKTADKMLKQIQQGGAELLGGLGVNVRADAALSQADEARHLLGVAEESGFKGMRAGRFNKMENAIKKEAYKRFVTNRGEGVTFKQGQANAAEWTSTQLSKLREKLAVSKDALGEHLTDRLTSGGSPEEPHLPLDVDHQLVLKRVQEILDPAGAEKARYREAMRKPKEPKDLGLSMQTMVRYLPFPK